jgi:hypothetical protein
VGVARRANCLAPSETNEERAWHARPTCSRWCRNGLLPQVGRARHLVDQRWEPGYKRGVPLLKDFLARLRFTLTALVVSTFPEGVKRSGWPSAYASAAAHVFSGWVEVVVSVGFFGIGFLRYVTGFGRSTGWTYLSNLPTTTIWDWRGLGLIGYLSYLVTPVAWVTLYCVVEGVLRALDAALSERMLGMAFVALPWRGALAVKSLLERRRHESRLGPERPDEVVVSGGSVVALTIYAAREKPWTENQVLEYGGEFYRSVGKRIVERGGHHAYRYDFRHLDPGEVVRGVLLRYPPEKEPPPRTNARGLDHAGSGKPAR